MASRYQMNSASGATFAAAIAADFVRIRPARRRAAHLSCELERRGLELGDVDDPVDQPERAGLGGFDAAVRERQLASQRAADQITDDRVDRRAPLHLGPGQVGRGGRDAKVAHHREVEASRQRRAVQRREQGQREAAQGGVPAVARRPEAVGHLGVVELPEIESGAEDGAGAGDDHDRDRFVGREGVERVGHVVSQLDRQGVATVRAVQSQSGDGRVDDVDLEDG